MTSATNAMPNCWVFYIQDFGVPTICCGTWSVSMHKAHIPLQKLQAVVLMLHKMAFCLCSKVVTLHLDKSTANPYLCNQGCAASLFLSRLGCHIMNLANKHVIFLIPAYIPTHLNVEAIFLRVRWLSSGSCFLT